MSFVEYISAGSSGRLDCIRRQIVAYETPYKPGAAFYQDFTDALIAGRRAETDELSLQRCVRNQSVPARKSHYDDLRRHWLAMPTIHLPFVPLDRALWEPPGLVVGISPELGLQKPDGVTLVTKLWLKDKEPAPEAIRAMHWLLTHHMESLHPGGQAAVLDFRREQLLLPTRRPYKKGYESWLVSEATGLAKLWNSLAKSA
ncbi:MAG: hypothetical protein H0W56_00300 [Acidothermales bacterium]|nr:hypothetical protein [Acidothermales bacterium]